MGIFSRIRSIFHKKDGKLELNEDVRELSTERAEQSATVSLEPGYIAEKETPFDPDIPGLWHDIRESEKRHICKPYTEESLFEVESELGYRLPESYKQLMKLHNGGLVNRTVVKMPEGVKERVFITEIFGIGSDAAYSLCGRFGSRFLTEGYRHNSDIGVAICNTMRPGRGLVFLDYRRCGRTGEPCVTYSDSETGTELVLARSFAQFVSGLSEVRFVFGETGYLLTE